MRVRSNTYAIMESLSSLHDLAVPEIARRRAVETRARQESGARAGERAEGARDHPPKLAHYAHRFEC